MGSGEREDWHYDVRESAEMSKRADESTSNVWHGSYSNAWRGVSKIILRPTIRALMKHDWHGQDNFRPDGGMIVAANHLSYADVLALALFCDQSGRYPTFLAKSTLFKIKILGPIIGKLGQLPVYRGQADAALVLRDAEQGVKDGACVVFYPEATVTRDPDLWPMVAKTGIARLALATGAPVIPVAHWGAQDILPYGSFKPHLLPRKTVHVIAGPPVDLSEFAGGPIDPETMRAATDKIMSDVAALLGKLRGEDPPAEPYHPAIARRRQREELRQLSGLSASGAGRSPGASATATRTAEPPGEAAPAEALAGEPPPAGSPPAETLASESPVGESPPAETLASESPVGESPPAETLASESPPAEAPPSESPPAEAVASESPPVRPAAEQPPAAGASPEVPEP